jgi:hypothetical protein
MVQKLPLVKKEETAAEKKRHYSMKILTQVGSIEHIDWGWSSYEDRRMRARRLHIFDGMIATLAVVQFTLVSYAAAFDPFDKAVLAISYLLDVLFAVDIVATVIQCYTTDLRNVELRKKNSKLDNHLKSFFLLDIGGILPTELIALMICEHTTSDIKYSTCAMPMLARLRINRLLSGYKTFRVP